jgi:radical SAM protein with 4Fe4S-binding SPASM domain
LTRPLDDLLRPPTEAHGDRPTLSTRYQGAKLENCRLLREDVGRRSPVFRGRPDVVMLNHTDICNLACVMCPRSVVRGEKQLSRHALERVADRLFPTARKVGLPAAEAEPLAVDFEFLIEKALGYGTQVDLVTNGTLLTLDRYRLARDAIDLLDVSIDCHVPEVYRRLRVGAEYSTVERNLRAICEERQRRPDDVLFVLNAIVMKSTLPHLPDLVRVASEFGAAALVLKHLNHDGKPTPVEDPIAHLGRETVARAYAECARVAKSVGMNLTYADCGLVDYDPPMPHVMVRPTRLPRGTLGIGADPCWYVAQNFHVSPDGYVLPCIRRTPHIAGNVLDQDPLDIWNGPVFQGLRKAHFERRFAAVCSECKLAPYLARTAGPPASRSPMP